MWELHDSNGNGLGDIWWTDKFIYFSIIDSQCKRRLTWSPKRLDSTNQKRLAHYAHAHCDVFQARLPWQGIVEVVQRQHFCHHGDTICHPKSGYVTIKLHGMSTSVHVDATIMRSFQTELFSSFLPVAYSDNVNLAAIKPWQFMPK